MKIMNLDFHRKVQVAKELQETKHPLTGRQIKFIMYALQGGMRPLALLRFGFPVFPVLVVIFCV